MRQREVEIYDLGEVGLEKAAPQPRAVPSPSRPRSQPDKHGVGPALAGSLSLFVPGLGQVVAGQLAWGVFFFSWIALCGTALWAIRATLDRLRPTLAFLALPPDTLPIAVGVVALAAMTLHLTSVIHAQASAPTMPRGVHPLPAGLASALVPGWGQILAGHVVRAALFLVCLWLIVVAWLLVTPEGMRLLAHAGLHWPSSVRDGWGPVVMLSTPIVLWIISVYDAVQGARFRD